MSNSKILDKLDKDIGKYGWHIISVFGENSLNFDYTVGFTETLNHPEIVISGLNVELMHGLLNDIGELIKQGYSFANGDTSSKVIKGYQVKFLSVDKSNIGEYFCADNTHYGEGNFEALQCIWPDQEGNFPLKTDNGQEVLS
jgi:hypothetical protein